MELGWIDFSKKDRDKTVSIMDLMKVKGTLDELGTAPVRDAYANLFFPGTSTIQTRAKYFLIVPYILKDLERKSLNDVKKLLEELNKEEMNCAEKLMENSERETGIIGADSVKENSDGSYTAEKSRWVKRPPSSIYWAGLKKYGLFKEKDYTLTEYFKVIADYNKDKNVAVNSRTETDSYEHDDKALSTVKKHTFLNLPESYTIDWKKDLKISLTKAEAVFLKEQIIKSTEGSLLSFVLKNKDKTFYSSESFEALENGIKEYPEEIQKQYSGARKFARFEFALRNVYNKLCSNGENLGAIGEKSFYKAPEYKEADTEKFKAAAALDLDEILSTAGLGKNDLRKPLSAEEPFLYKAQKSMENGDFKELEEQIIAQEIFLKTKSRAKASHPVEGTEWIGGKNELDYRFDTVKNIVKDILEAEGAEC